MVSNSATFHFQPNRLKTSLAIQEQRSPTEPPKEADIALAATTATVHASVSSFRATPKHHSHRRSVTPLYATCGAAERERILCCASRQRKAPQTVRDYGDGYRIRHVFLSLQHLVSWKLSCHTAGRISSVLLALRAMCFICGHSFSMQCMNEQ